MAHPQVSRPDLASVPGHVTLFHQVITRMGVSGWVSGTFLPVPGQATMPLSSSLHSVSPLPSPSAGDKDT